MPGGLSIDEAEDWLPLLPSTPSGITAPIVQSIETEIAVSTSATEDDLLINFSDEDEEYLSSTEFTQPFHDELSGISMIVPEFSNDDAIAEELEDDNYEDDEPLSTGRATSALSQLLRLDFNNKNWSLWDEISPCLSQDNPFRYPSPIYAAHYLEPMSPPFTSSSRTLRPMYDGFSDRTQSPEVPKVAFEMVDDLQMQHAEKDWSSPWEPRSLQNVSFPGLLLQTGVSDQTNASTLKEVGSDSVFTNFTGSYNTTVANTLMIS